jgi:putative cell wall-binding protein
MLAENVGYASPADDAAVSRLHQAFMNSDGHRKHILDTRATQVGVGVEVRNNTVWATVNFRQPKPGAPPALPRRQTPVQRIAGGDRISTAVAVSQQVFPRADAVVLARADQYPDALAGASLAAALGGPVLLTAPDHLSEATTNEIRRVGATTVVLLGGTGALGREVERQLHDAGVTTIDRIAGSSRIATAAEIARRVGGGAAYVVEGSSPDPARGWPDALSVAALAARQRRPILLTSRDELPAETREVLADLNVSQVTIVGGTGAVSDAVAGAIAARGVRVDRVAGGDRYATAAAVADRAVVAGLGAEQVWLATGRNWPDALAAGPAAARAGVVLLLVDGVDPAGDPTIHQWLAARAGRVGSARVIGGPGVVSDSVAARIAADGG